MGTVNDFGNETKARVPALSPVCTADESRIFAVEWVTM